MVKFFSVHHNHRHMCANVSSCMLNGYPKPSLGKSTPMHFAVISVPGLYVGLSRCLGNCLVFNAHRESLDNHR